MRIGLTILNIFLAYLLVGCQFLDKRFYVSNSKIINNQVKIKVSDRFDYSACLDKTLINAANLSIKNNHKYFSLNSTKKYDTTSFTSWSWERMPGMGNSLMYTHKTRVIPGCLESTIQFSDKKESIKYFDPYIIKENLEKKYEFKDIHKSAAYLQSREDLILNSYFCEVELLQENIYLAKCTGIPSAFSYGFYDVGLKAVELAKSKNIKFIRVIEDNTKYSDEYFNSAIIQTFKVSKKKNLNTTPVDFFYVFLEFTNEKSENCLDVEKILSFPKKSSKSPN